jgi:hypothetical protein
VHVVVDEPRHHVQACRIDLVVCLLGRTVRAQRQAGHPGRPNGADPVLLDYDVYGTHRRRAGAVNQRRTPDHEGVERPPPLVRAPRRRRIDGGTLRIRGRRLRGQRGEPRGAGRGEGEGERHRGGERCSGHEASLQMEQETISVQSYCVIRFLNLTAAVAPRYTLPLATGGLS